MRVWAVSLLLLAGCDLVLLGKEQPGRAGVYRKTITIQQTGLTTPLTDFPLAVFIDDTSLRDRARSGGRDITFAIGDMKLDRRIIAYQDGRLEAWVRVPSLVDGTMLFMDYGGADDDRPGDVFPTTRFWGAWHMAQGADAEEDVTASKIDVTSTSMATSPRPEPNGVVGRARDFDGVDDRLCGPAAGAVDFGMQSFSFSAWIKVTAEITTGNFDHPLHAGGSGAGFSGFAFELAPSAWRAYVHDGAGPARSAEMNAPHPINTWAHLVGVVDRTTNKVMLYVNGNSFEASIMGMGPVVNEDAFCFAANTTFFTGLLDEARVYNFAVDQSWVRAEYGNLAKPTTFLAFGDELAL